MQSEETPGQTPEPEARPYVEPDPRDEADTAIDAGEEMPESQTPEEEDDMSDLTPQQLRSIELATRGVGHVQIAKILRVSRKTLWRWKTFDREYRRVLVKTRLEAHSTNADRYHVLLHKATGVLSKFMEDESGQNRFQAARIVLAMAGCFKPVLSKAEHSELDAMPEPDVPPDMA